MFILSFLAGRASMLIKAAFAVLILAAANPASSQIREYYGGGVLADYWGCERHGWPVNNEMIRVRYMPRSQTGARNSELVFHLAVGGTAAMRFNFELERHNGWRAAYGQAIWGGVFWLRDRPSIRVLSAMDVHGMAPWSAGSTQPAAIRIRIRNFNGLRGCAVGAYFTLTPVNG